MRFSKEFLVSVLLLTAAALLLHAVSRGEEVVPRRNFAEFPLTIGQWSGKAGWFGDDMLRVLRVDDYMMRRYADSRGLPVELYVGYYQSMRQGATYHSPKNCLPGNGWYFERIGKTRIPSAESHRQAMEINQVLIAKGLEKALVLYWYQDRGRIITSEYWAKIYLVLDAIAKNRTDGAFVRVTVPFVGDDDDATVLTRGMAFVERVFPLLAGYLPS